MRRRSSRRARSGDLDPLGDVVGDRLDVEHPAVDVDLIAGDRDAVEVIGDEAGEGLVRAVGAGYAERRQLVGADDAVGLPAGPAVGGGVELDERVDVVGVVLVRDAADDLLDDVLQRDDPDGAAVLVDDDGQRLVLAQPVEEVVGGQRSRGRGSARSSGRRR